MSTHSSPSTRKSSLGLEGVDDDDDDGTSSCTRIVGPDHVSDEGDDEGRVSTEEESEEDEEAERSEPVSVSNSYY